MIRRRDSNENVIKKIGFKGKTTPLRVHHTFLYISLPFLRDYDVKLPEFLDCPQVKKCQIFIKVIMPFISDPLQKLNLSPPVKAHAFVTLGK